MKLWGSMSPPSMPKGRFGCFKFLFREGGDIGLFITLVPKVLLERFLIHWLNNLGDFC